MNMIFAVNFCAKKHRNSNGKYSNLIMEIYLIFLITCAKCIPDLLIIYPIASYVFLGSRTIDVNSDKIEG